MPRHEFEVDKDFKGGEPRNNLIVKVVEALLLLLAPAGITLEDLAEGLGLKPRSTRRYLSAFAQARVHLTEEMLDDGRKLWGIDRSDPLVKLAAAHDPFTVVSLHMSAMEASGFHLMGGVAELQGELIDSVAEVLGPKYQGQLQRLLSYVRPARHGIYKRQPPPNASKKLLRAMDEGLVCTVTYAAARDGGRELSTYEILPKWFHPHDSGWYVFHYSYKENAYANLNLSRLHDVEVTDRKGVEPPGVDAEALFRASYGAFIEPELYDYRIRLNAEKAVLAKERTWHETEEWRPLKGGYWELTFRAPKTPEIINLVLKFRDGAVALGPTWLTDELHDQWQFMRPNYPRRSDKKKQVRRERKARAP